MTTRSDEPHAEARVLAALDDMPDGLTVKQIGAITGLSRRYLTTVCGLMAERRDICVGRLMGVGSTTMLLIARPEHRETLMARCADDKAARAEKARQRKRLANLRSIERRPSFVEAQKYADSPFKHLRVDAHQAKPLPKRGVASVWEFAEVSA